MADNLKLTANTREDLGKGASRRLRHENKVPAIIYGGTDPVSITLLHKELHKLLENEAFYSSILDLSLDDKEEPVILKDLQRHPSKDLILHADFQRVDLKKELHVFVPIHFTNEDLCVGVKISGGVIAHLKTSVEVACLPNALPEYIEVDMTNVELGDILHISDITLPEGVSSVALTHDHDLAIVQVNAPKRAEEATETEGDDNATDAPAEDESEES